MNPLFMHALAARRIDALVIGASAGGMAWFKNDLFG